MVCDLFVDAYRAGASGQDGNYGTARASRARLIEKISALYNEIGDLKSELEHESYNREQYQVELHAANMETHRLKKEIRRLNKQLDFQADPENYMESFEEVPDHHDAFDAMFPGCTPDDLPFPDVEPLADAEEVEGANEL